MMTTTSSAAAMADLSPPASAWPSRKCSYCGFRARIVVAYCCECVHEIVVRFLCVPCHADFTRVLERGLYRCSCGRVFSDWLIRWRDSTEEWGMRRAGRSFTGAGNLPRAPRLLR